MLTKDPAASEPSVRTHISAADIARRAYAEFLHNKSNYYTQPHYAAHLAIDPAASEGE